MDINSPGLDFFERFARRHVIYSDESPDVFNAVRSTLRLRRSANRSESDSIS